MHLIKLSDSDKLRYSDFVSSRNGSFLQSWEWGEWQSSLGKIAHRFFVKDGDTIFLAAQILETPLPYLGSYLYIPYGPTFIDHVANEKNDGILQTLIEGLPKLFPNTIFIRLEPFDQLNPTGIKVQKTKHIQPGKTLVVDLSKTENELLSAMHPKTRYNIKVAEKRGVQIQKINAQNLSEQDISLCIKLIQETAQRQQYRNHSDAYFTKLFNFLKQQSADAKLHASFYLAQYQNTPIVTGVMVDFGPTRMYLYGGSSDQHRDVMAPYLLHWKAMTDAKNQGMQYYDLGGSETANAKEQGFTRFKLGFGGHQVEYPDAIDLVLKPLTYQLYKIARLFA